MSSVDNPVSLIGVKAAFIEPVFKCDLLLFDQIVTPSFGEIGANQRNPDLRAELEWLIENKLVALFDFQTIDPNLQLQDFEISHPILWFLLALAAGIVCASGDREHADPAFLFGAAFNELNQTALRSTAAMIEASRHVRSIPLVESFDFFGGAVGGIQPNAHRILKSLKALPRRIRYRSVLSLLDEFAGKESSIELPPLPAHIADLRPIAAVEHMLSEYQAVESTPSVASPAVEIVLNALPVPDESVPWEQILEFRQDERVRYYLLSLRKWMREMVTQEKSGIEISEELEYLLAGYQEELSFHKMKMRYGTWAAMAVTSMDVISSLANLRFRDAIKAALEIRKHSITTLEAERSARGREVAYILKVREKFSKA